ncbi:MAG: hypothetical protein LBH43_11295, partial [Treponema sp.]|nr:hypothetical protein [Treponema sp.]
NKFKTGKFRDIAAVGDTLYAVDEDGKVWSDKGISWSDPVNTSVPIGKKIVCIFGAGDCLFAGVLFGNPGNEEYDIYIFDSTPSTAFFKKVPNTAKLMGVGAIGTNYYIGTMGDGMYLYANGATPFQISGYLGEEVKNIVSVTVYNSILYSIHYDLRVRLTKIFSFDETAITPVASGNFTSALTGWTNGTESLLLVGLQRSSGTFGYGYREIVLPSSSVQSPRIPGADDPTSVDRNSQYISAIGKYVVNHLFVVSESPGDKGGRPIIFASTAQNGLWSYRIRTGDEKPQWNGE